MITACLITLVEARHFLVKARDFIQKQRIQKLTSPKPTVPSAVLKKKEKAPKTKEPESQHRKVCQADKDWARKLEQGYAQHMDAQQIIDEWLESLTHPPLLDASYSSREDTDNGPYESGIEPQSALSDNPSPYEVTDSESEDHLSCCMKNFYRQFGILLIGFFPQIWIEDTIRQILRYIMAIFKICQFMKTFWVHFQKNYPFRKSKLSQWMSDKSSIVFYLALGGQIYTMSDEPNFWRTWCTHVAVMGHRISQVHFLDTFTMG